MSKGLSLAENSFENRMQSGDVPWLHEGKGAFLVADHRSDAYHIVVEELPESARYGRTVVGALVGLARYADSKGFLIEDGVRHRRAVAITSSARSTTTSLTTSSCANLSPPRFFKNF